MSPELLATILILISAILHAVVNAIVKISDDGLLTRGCMNAIALIVSAPFTIMVPFPTPEVWQILIMATLVHGLYPFFLAGAYRYGDLSAVMPLARGTTPLGVALLAGFAVNEPLSAAKIASIALISLAVASFAFERGALSSASRRHGMILALITGLIIAVYTTIDGVGLRMAETKMSYIVWLFVMDGAFVSSSVALARRSALVPFLKRHWKPALTGGVFGIMTYGLALYALGLGTIAEIAALRETSTVFAVLIGTFFLGEHFGARRVVAAFLVATGAIALQVAS